MNKEILTQIDNTIKYIWTYDIKQDYDNKYLLKEDTLKNAFYFHLRNKMSSLLEQYNLRIYTEFTDNIFKGTNHRPDIIIAKIDPNSEENYLGDWITEVVSIIEIKYQSDSYSAIKNIESDYEKIRWYTENLSVDAKYYMATIWEVEDSATTWIRKNAKWAKGKLTELNASYESDEMRFYIYEHKPLKRNPQ